MKNTGIKSNTRLVVCGNFNFFASVVVVCRYIYKFKYGKGNTPWERARQDPPGTAPGTPWPEEETPPDPMEGYVKVRDLRRELGWSDADFINTASGMGIIAKEFMLDGYRIPCVTREEYKRLRRRRH